MNAQLFSIKCFAIIAIGSASLITSISRADDVEEIQAALAEIIGPRGATAEVIASPMADVYQADIGGRVVFISKTGDHMLLGDVFDMQRKVSLSEEIKQQKALAVIDEIDEAEMIVFAPKETKRTVTVYTDVDCPYCRKLHEEVPDLLESGIKVRYLWYPRSGVGTPSYDKAVSIWCAEDQNNAMDEAKLNNKIVDAKCDPNPVSSQYASGQKVGVRGTPTIVVDDGTIIGGYLPADNLIASLGLAPKKSLAKNTPKADSKKGVTDEAKDATDSKPNTE